MTYNLELRTLYKSILLVSFWLVLVTRDLIEIGVESFYTSMSSKMDDRLTVDLLSVLSNSEVRKE